MKHTEYVIASLDAASIHRGPLSPQQLLARRRSRGVNVEASSYAVLTPENLERALLLHETPGSVPMHTKVVYYELLERLHAGERLVQLCLVYDDAPLEGDPAPVVMQPGERAIGVWTLAVLAGQKRREVLRWVRSGAVRISQVRRSGRLDTFVVVDEHLDALLETCAPWNAPASMKHNWFEAADIERAMRAGQVTSDATGALFRMDGRFIRWAIRWQPAEERSRLERAAQEAHGTPGAPAL